MSANERFLTLMRHAKAARDLEGIDEFDRPLTTRGVHDAALMAETMRDRLPPVDLLLVSSARRARITGEIVGGILGLPSGAMLLEERFYMAEPEQLLYRLQELPPDPSHVLLVAHNPALEELTSLLRGGAIDKLPTSACAAFRLDADSWSLLSPEHATFLELLTPKEVGRE